MPFADNTGPMFSDAYSSTTATIFSPTNLLNYDTPSSTTPQLRFLSHHSVPPKSQADSNAAFLSDPTIVDQDAPSSGDEDFTNFPSENWPFRSPGPSGLPLARQRLTPPQIFPAQVKGLSPIRYNNLVYETPYNSAEYFSDNSLDPSHSPPTAIIRSFGNVLHHPSPRKLVSLESLDSSPSIAVPDSRYNHFASTHEVADHPPSGDATASHVPFDCPSEDADSLNRCGDISGSELRAPGFLSEPDFDENKENESPFALDVGVFCLEICQQWPVLIQVANLGGLNAPHHTSQYTPSPIDSNFIPYQQSSCTKARHILRQAHRVRLLRLRRCSHTCTQSRTTFFH
jgi:hypothetical protein